MLYHSLEHLKIVNFKIKLERFNLKPFQFLFIQKERVRTHTVIRLSLLPPRSGLVQYNSFTFYICYLICLLPNPPNRAFRGRGCQDFLPLPAANSGPLIDLFATPSGGISMWLWLHNISVSHFIRWKFGNITLLHLLQRTFPRPRSPRPDRTGIDSVAPR